MKKILGCEGVEGNGGNISSSDVDMAASKENFAAQNGSNSNLPLAYADHGHVTKVQVNKDQARLVLCWALHWVADLRAVWNDYTGRAN